jgi:hypothetical protein
MPASETAICHAMALVIDEWWSKKSPQGVKTGIIEK